MVFYGQRGMSSSSQQQRRGRHLLLSIDANIAYLDERCAWEKPRQVLATQLISVLEFRLLSITSNKEKTLWRTRKCREEASSSRVLLGISLGPTSRHVMTKDVVNSTCAGQWERIDHSMALSAIAKHILPQKIAVERAVE